MLPFFFEKLSKDISENFYEHEKLSFSGVEVYSGSSYASDATEDGIFFVSGSRASA